LCGGVALPQVLGKTEDQMPFKPLRRREFLALTSSVATWPLAARAQRKLPVIGWFNTHSAQAHSAELAAFRRGLAESGYVEGQNVTIEYRWADDHYDRLPALAADLVDRKVAVIAACTPPSALAAKAVTATIPVVFANGADPVASGLVASLARPGGNLTGGTILTVELAPKRLELLQEALPGRSTIVALINPAGDESEAKKLQEAARALGVQLQILYARPDQEIESTFENVVRLRAGGLVIGDFLGDRIEQVAALSLRHGAPAIYPYRSFPAAGGLMSYGASLADAFKLAGAYTARVLNGEKPADLPVQQSTKVELTINTKAAKALGITMPITLLARADDVIE
jgi:putative tryptophan/tyrosine transport system substrate-binding protein